MNDLTFIEAKEKYFKTLKQYVPVVERVHGGAHPEFYVVRELVDAMEARIKRAGFDKPELNEVFAKLREATNNYRVPDDVCESYEAVYTMLAELDKAYHV